MRVLVVVAHDGDVVVACVVKRPAQERHVVRETAIAHVFGHGDGNLMRVVLARLHGRQRLADHDLRREADVVVHVLLAQANGLLAAHLQRRRLELGACHGGRHDARERVRGVGHEDGLVGVFARELARVGIAQLMHLKRDAGSAAHGRRLDERLHTDAQGPRHVGLVELHHERHLARNLVHEPADLVGEVGVVAAAEAHELHVLEVLVARRDRGAGKHARVVVVHDVDDGVRQVHLVHARHRVGAHHGDSLVAEELGQAVMDERVVVIGARGEHHGVGAVLLCLLDHHGAACLQGCREALLRSVALSHGGQAGRLVDAPGLGHVRAELAPAVGLGVPVEQRILVARAAFLGVVGVAHHHGVALHHRTHALACGMGVLGFDRGDRGHEDEVDAGRLELADVAVHELGGEAHGVGGDGGQALLVHAACGGAAHADLESQRPPERFPEGQRVPVAEHKRDAHDLALSPAQGFDLVVAAKKLQALVEEVGRVLALGAGRRAVEVGAA